MKKQSKQIRTIEDAVDILKVQVFDRLETGDNSLADIETIARVINSISLTQEHVVLTRQSERYANTEPLELAPGSTFNKGVAFEDASSESKVDLGETFNL
jgi:hypothetical protein